MPWRWARDTWDGRDKLWHLLGGLVSPLLLWAAFQLWRGWCVLGSLAFWWLWEVKDAFARRETWGWLGGDGFSWRDGLASSVGILFAWMILELFKTCLVGA